GKTKDELLLLEIDENLIRHELNPLDRAAFLSQRKEVYERLHPDARHGGDRKSEGFKNQNEIISFWSFSEDAAEQAGLSKRSIEMAVALHNRLSPDVRKQIAGTALARNQSELTKLSKLTPDMQVKVAWIILDADNEAEKVATAVAIAGGHTPKPAANSGEAKVRRAYDAFNRLNKREQDRVLVMIGQQRLLEFIAKTTKPILKAAD
ncbi:MAG: hypothetical protein COB00_12715, partial [Alcanivorax sp.]